jgi:hypothetical protein
MNIIPHPAQAIRSGRLKAAHIGHIAQEDSEAHPALSQVAGASSYREVQ